MKKQKLNLFIIVISLMLPWSVFAQTKYELNTGKSEVIIHGTSSIHDWEMPAAKFSGELVVYESEGEITQITEAVFSIDAKSISSDNKIMDNKTYKALNTKEYSKITFEFKRIDQLSISEGKVSGAVNGDLLIAGVTKNVIIPLTLTKGLNRNYETGGVFNLKMTDFGIAPPTAMLGALKTGDDVSVHYKFVFEQISQSSMSINSKF